MMRRYSYLAFIFALGCGGSNPMLGGDDQPPSDADNGGGSADADVFVPPAGYTKLVGRTWSLAPGATNIYKCVRITIPQDMYITDIEAQAPLGTHHTVLSIAGANGTSGADGEQDCGVATLGMQMLYASGVGTSPLNFPSGVGVKIAAGTQIHLNLHLYNAGDEPLSGESAIWVKSQATPTPTLAEMVFAGSQAIYLPNNPNMEQKVSGTCTMNQAYKLFALWPHMHKIATHQKIELLQGSNTPVPLLDEPYQFEEQKYWLQNPEIQVQQGDKIRVTCSYLNDTGGVITFGDGSDKEMCFGGMFRYPASNSSIFCLN